MLFTKQSTVTHLSVTQALETELLSIPRSARVVHSGSSAVVAKQQAEAKLVGVFSEDHHLPHIVTLLTSGIFVHRSTTLLVATRMALQHCGSVMFHPVSI